MREATTIALQVSDFLKEEGHSMCCGKVSVYNNISEHGEYREQ
jgi:hypothetical protein